MKTGNTGDDESGEKEGEGLSGVDSSSELNGLVFSSAVTLQLMRNATRKIVAAGSTNRFMVLGPEIETYCVLGNVIAHALLITHVRKL